MENAKDIRDWCEEQWRGKGVINGGYRNVFVQGPGGIQIKSGSQPTYKSKEQKAYEARFGIYNKKLAPVILAQATRDDRFSLPRYSWPKEDAAPTAPAESKASTSIPRKRVSRVKLAQAQEILSKVPQDELAGFLARFGLSMSLAASIASLDNVEQIARQFLRATL